MYTLHLDSDYAVLPPWRSRTAWAKASLKALSSSPAPSSKGGRGREDRGEGDEVEEDKGLVSFVCNVVGQGKSGGGLHSQRSVRSAVV